VTVRRVRLARFGSRQVAALRLIARSAGRRPAHLVGGAVRDLLLGRAVDDLDVIVPSGALGLARRLADRTDGTYVELDAARGAARVILRRARVPVQVDVADFRAPGLAADLAERDFTINALAVPVASLVREGVATVVDPLGGLADLRARRLRLAGPDAISDDPSRAVRGVRLEAQLGARLDPRARRAIRSGAAGIRNVAVERITQELVEILKLPHAAVALRRADRLGVLAATLPEIEPLRGVAQPEPHRFDVLEHSLRAVAAADLLLARINGLAPWGPLLAAHLAESLGGGVTRRETLKLGALLHDIAKPATRQLREGRIRFFGHDLVGAERSRTIGERLRLPQRAVRVVETLVRHHLRMMHLEQAGEVTRRARYRFFRDLGEDARDLLLLSLADAAAVRGVSPLYVWRRAVLVRDLMTGWREETAARAAPPLLRGEDVMAEFDLRPGPEVGRLLGRAREAQDLGLVQSREEAIEYLRSVTPPRLSPGGGAVVSWPPDARP
jgi:poly(A) polymerase/tRNA nucleotidyltransferase (CCA-adding enzyme)